MVHHQMLKPSHPQNLLRIGRYMRRTLCNYTHICRRTHPNTSNYQCTIALLLLILGIYNPNNDAATSSHARALSGQATKVFGLQLLRRGRLLLLFTQIMLQDVTRLLLSKASHLNSSCSNLGHPSYLDSPQSTLQATPSHVHIHPVRQKIKIRRFPSRLLSRRETQATGKFFLPPRCAF